MRQVIISLMAVALASFAGLSLANEYKPGDAITPADYPSLKNPAMKFSQPSVNGRMLAKDPSVIRFKGKYWMYYSLFSADPKVTGYNLHIGVATKAIKKDSALPA